MTAFMLLENCIMQQIIFFSKRFYFKHLGSKLSYDQMNPLHENMPFIQESVSKAILTLQLPTLIIKKKKRFDVPRKRMREKKEFPKLCVYRIKICNHDCLF